MVNITGGSILGMPRQSRNQNIWTVDYYNSGVQPPGVTPQNVDPGVANTYGITPGSSSGGTPTDPGTQPGPVGPQSSGGNVWDFLQRPGTGGNPWDFLNPPGTQDQGEWGKGDFANFIGNLMHWFGGQNGLTSQGLMLLSQLLGGKWPSALEPHFPTDLANSLLGNLKDVVPQFQQLGSGMMKDAWGMAKDEMVNPLVEAFRSKTKLDVDSQTRDALRQLNENTSGGNRQQGVTDLMDKSIAARAQADQQGIPQIMSSAFGSLAPGLFQMAMGPAANLLGLYPNVLNSMMTSFQPQIMSSALQAGLNIPMMLLQMAMGGGQLRNQQYAASKSGGGGGLGGLLGGLF